MAKHRRGIGSYFVIGSLITFVLGCGGAGRPSIAVHRASGSVTWDGKPLEGASVQFHSVEPIKLDGKETPVMPGAQSKSNGSFDVTTFRSGDGLPQGDYLVTVSCENRSTKPKNGDYPELLPAHFQDPNKSGLKVTIKSGTNKLDPFELKK